jgi:hypothetical protein
MFYEISIKLIIFFNVLLAKPRSSLENAEKKFSF